MTSLMIQPVEIVDTLPDDEPLLFTVTDGMPLDRLDKLLAQLIPEGMSKLTLK